MIPKIIHYCWFGRGPMPEDNLKCIESWKKFLPDYKLMLWNEDNYDVNSIKFTRQAYQKKKYAFVIDRSLQLLREHGGIWLDTDIEIIKNLDPLLELPAFMSFESDTLLHTGIVGSEKGAAWTDEYWKYMNRKPFIRWNGRLNKTPSTVIISRILKKRRKTGQHVPDLRRLPAHLPERLLLPERLQNRKNHDNGQHVLHPPLRRFVEVIRPGGRNGGTETAAGTGFCKF
ncbi:MAG: glycosyltransferase family 32 protein [Alistipes sp.]